MKRRSKALFVVLTLSLGAALSGQSSLHGLRDGAWFPVLEIKGGHPILFTGDELVRGSREELALLPASDFADGFIKVDVLTNVREGVSRREGALMYSSDRSWYSLKARIVSDVDLPSCYFAMRFDTFGDASYYCKPIGDLRAGKPAVVEIFMKVGYEMPQQLHIFSGMDEVRTTLVPNYYRYRGGEFLLASH